MSRGSYAICHYSIHEQGLIHHLSLQYKGTRGFMSLVTTACRSRGSYVTCNYIIQEQGVICHSSLQHPGAGGHESIVTTASPGSRGRVSLVTTSPRSRWSYFTRNYSIQEQVVIFHLSLQHLGAMICHLSLHNP